jgi:hypothetical protein
MKCKRCKYILCVTNLRIPGGFILFFCFRVFVEKSNFMATDKLKSENVFSAFKSSF